MPIDGRKMDNVCTGCGDVIVDDGPDWGEPHTVVVCLQRLRLKLDALTPKNEAP